MKKKLFILELNEINFNFCFKGSDKHDFFFVKKFFSDKKKINTYTNDKREGYNLDPWVQWVSVHTGKQSSVHKTYRSGQMLNKSIKQIWEKLSEKKINSSIWGVFNSTLNLKKNIDLFFPDPWSFKQKAYPNYFQSFLKLPRYYAQNYPTINKVKIFYYGLTFFNKIIFSSVLIDFLKILPGLIKMFLISKFKSFNLYFVLDLLSLIILKNSLKKNSSQLSVVALNSFAHYQHNYWDKKQFEYVYFWYLDRVLKIISQITKKYDSLIIYNGFDQKKIKNEFHLRFKEPKLLFKKLNLRYINLETNMTTGATVYFSSISNKVNAINKLRSIRLYSYPVFEIQNFKNEKKIFFQFSLISQKENYSIKVLKKKYYNIFFKKPTKILKKKNMNKKDELLLDYIFKNSIFIKSTSRHIRQGTLFYKNFNFSKKNINSKGIKNDKIFYNILNFYR